MDSLIITGGQPLKGRVRISGAKNAALPLMCAALLSEEPLRLANVPDLADIQTMSRLLAALGVTVDKEKVASAHTLTVNAKTLDEVVAPYDLVRKMRASILVLGPLLARCGIGKISLPGGCAIGNRPINLHLTGFEAMGAEITLEEGYVEAKAPRGGLKGAEIIFPFVSVGATENLIMAASLAKGRTVLKNAAREPEIADLAECLNAMGANITGAGSAEVIIDGVASLGGANHPVMPDRIETGSYAIAALITGGTLTLEGARADLLGDVLPAFEKTGGTIEETDDGLLVHNGHGRPKPLTITTQPFPGFATDMQAQFMALLALGRGTSEITETIFENRYMHVPELRRMGADIEVSGSKATIRGVDHLIGAPVMATDLRASMCLVLAALAAEGETTLSRVYHLDRGYEHLETKLGQVGAVIERIGAGV
ncbi:MAG: UDP-N-acetylglucosamine 1-carboxyvinyltransferase [Sphingomonadales bacterium]